jgi:ATP-binding cassette subfamily B protein/subfamily B ATP-binding cassette protein MsbA
MVACILAAGTAAITWVGAREVSAGRLPVGHLLVFLAYLGQLYEPLNQLSNVGATLSVAGAGTRRVLELLDAGQPGVVEGQATPPEEGRQCSLEFDQVVAGYTPGRPVLKRLRLSVRGGETVAIIGPSGAGKSTLLALLLRFVEPEAGRITLNGHDLREFSLQSLRHCVAWVPQEPFLLPGTLAENIAFGAAKPSRDAIEAAARAANAHDFIQRLPQGYDTVVGDGAARLSAGEKQRLSLARAFIKQAPILLLDEPTSALDGESERLILESLRSWGRERTVLMVAHRLQTLDIADRIVVLRDGEVVEQGTPAELVAKGGYFATLSGNH